MAMAGLVMTGYLVFHMITNLSFFAGEQFESFYAFYNQAWVRWPLLLIVLTSLAIHVRAAVVIRRKNSQARRVGYYKHDKFHVPAAFVTISIILLFLFIILHVLQTLSFDTQAVSASMTSLFSSLVMVLIYLAGLFILAMHLSHSIVNVLQTLGVSSNMYRNALLALVAIVMLGFASVPVYIWMMA
jgi:succinate dehydrogenase / fumarate reductase cytochrome b subunit